LKTSFLREIFFDNNLPPTLAYAIRELCKPEKVVEEVIHLKDRFAQNCPDEDWLGSLAAEEKWVVISQDRFNKSPVEKQAIKSRGLVVFSLEKAWASQTYWNKARNLVHWWPAILDQSTRYQGGAALGVPWRLSGRGSFRQINIG